MEACTVSAWSASCPLAVEGPAHVASINRYAEEKEFHGVACDTSDGNEPSEESRVHAGDQVKAFNAAGTLIGLTSAVPGISSAQPGGVSEVRAAADTVVIVVTCPLSFELQLTVESPSPPSQLATHQDPTTHPVILKNRDGRWF